MLPSRPGPGSPALPLVWSQRGDLDEQLRYVVFGCF